MFDIKVEPHLVKHYRVRFEQGYAHRYLNQRPEEVELMPFLEPFVKALGFHHRGPRALNMHTQADLLDSLFAYVLKRNHKTESPELALAKYLAIAAFLHDYGGDCWKEYSQLESFYRVCYNINQNRVRILGKEVYSCITMRFDQYMTCSPITPIRWNSTKKMGRSTSSHAVQQRRDDLDTRWEQWKAKYSK